MIKKSEILYEDPNQQYYVVAATFGSGRFRSKSHGYEVYENGVTHAKRVASIGYSGQVGLEKAKTWIDERLSA